MNKNIQEPHTAEILTKMCEMVGVDYKTFDFNQPNWYWQHTWTKEQEAEFITWLAQFLLKHKYTRKGKYRGEDKPTYDAKKIVWNYGWKVSNP